MPNHPQLIRTTLRLDSRLKRAAEEQAYQQDTTLQAIFNQALQEYVERSAIKQAEAVFHSYHLGKKLDKLSRDDYYDSP